MEGTHARVQGNGRAPWPLGDQDSKNTNKRGDLGRIAPMAEIDFEASPLAPRRTEEEHARDRDLGFGSVVSRQSRQRLLNPDGSFNVVRSGLGLLESLAPYQQLLTVSWTGFFAIVFASYLLINLLFAIAYLLDGATALLGPGADMLGGQLSKAFF